MRQIKYIVLHCTATPQTATVEAIQKYWRSSLGWKSPGYHHIIPASGNPVRLAEDEQICNGVKGFNSNAIHISYIGGVDEKNKPTDNRTASQRGHMLALVNHYKALYPAAEVKGHRDFPNVKKACPSFDVATWLKSIGLIFAIFLLASCSPQKRLADLVRKHPELVTTDTVYQPIPVIRAEVVRDTVFEWSTDTITIEKDRLRVDVVMDTITKKIYVKGQCKADTVIVHVPVEVNTIKPVEVIKERKPSFFQKVWYAVVWGGILWSLFWLIIWPVFLRHRFKVRGE
jgi:N-acetylmuramoyl-L-alanine amidase